VSSPIKNRRKKFEDIFHEHYAPLCNYAAKIVRDFEAAEEIVQDLFVNLLDNQALDKVEHIDRFLIRSVKFRCIDFIRRKEKLHTIPLEYLEENDVVDSEPDSEEEIHALFLYMVAKLPPKTKEVFMLVRQTGLSYKEAAEKLDISIKTVENQMSRAFKKMRTFLKDYGYTAFLYFLIK
jgi:RNA polymerase sigma-70 factor, ECF subfamily